MMRPTLKFTKCEDLQFELGVRMSPHRIGKKIPQTSSKNHFKEHKTFHLILFWWGLSKLRKFVQIEMP